MDEKQQLMELYKEFMYTKENFVNRSFATNKFYIVAITLCLFAVAAIIEYANPTSGSLSIVAVSLAGFAFSLLLWANQDAYAYLLRLKFGNVIDKMEESFCFQPCVKEKEAIIENAKKKRSYVFADVQKTFALTTMSLFLASFLYHLIQVTVALYV